MVFATGGRRFGLAMEAVDRVVRMVAISPLPGAPPVILGAVNVQGEVVAVADVCRRLGLGAPGLGPDAQLLLARTARRRLAFAVQAVSGVVEVPAAAIASAASLSPGSGVVAGAVGLPDGIVFIHDPDAFLTAEEEHRLDGALAGT